MITKSLVQLPVGFAATRIPGYFWDVNNHKLYSSKSGVLTELTILIPNRYNALSLPAYRVSHQGKKRWITLEELVRIELVETTFPVDPRSPAERRQNMLHARYTKAVEQAEEIKRAKRRTKQNPNQLHLM